jgi:uncharacterized membrane protein YdjX (TVP38/TMEM64 family)
VWDYLAAFGVVLGVNLLPAFGPPTWAVLVLFRLQSGLNGVVLVLLGALAAALGRLALAGGTRAMRGHLSRDRQESLDALGDGIRRHPRAGVLGIGLFVLSPLPSAQLFEAAGLTRVRLVPLVAAFFAGRLVTYSAYVAGATALKQSSIGDMVVDSMTSPAGVALQLALLAGVVALARIDWRPRLARAASGPGPGPGHRTLTG